MPRASQSIHGIWGSRLTFILAATGSAVGLGNIWKFPYITGENGGGAFVLMYLFCILIVGIPIMMAEVLLGRRGRQSPVNAMIELAREAGAPRVWGLLGWIGVVAGFLILSYYSVIAGWALEYVLRVGEGTFIGAKSEFAGSAFNELTASPGRLAFWHTVFMFMTMFVVAKGVNRGLEAAVRILMPALLVLLMILIGYAVNSGSFMQGFDFLFSMRTENLNANSLVIAMGHAFFTLSLGMGAIMIYGAYMPRNASIGATVCVVALLDTLVALVAGLAIFPLVFANGLEAGAGPGLMFVTLPLAFGNMPFGSFFGVLFFVLVSFAAWSSSISLIEPAVAWMVERFGMSRVKTSIGLGIAVWLVGLGTVFSFNIWKSFNVFGLTFFDALDFLTANIMLPLGGVAIAVFAGWVMREPDVHAELAIESKTIYRTWRFLVRFVSPAAVLFIFALTMYRYFTQ